MITVHALDRGVHFGLIPPHEYVLYVMGDRQDCSMDDDASELTTVAFTQHRHDVCKNTRHVCRPEEMPFVEMAMPVLGRATILVR
jgi:hypothetical protein